MHKIFLAFLFVNMTVASDKYHYLNKLKEHKKNKRSAQEIKADLDKMIKDSFYDESVDYSRFQARITDRDESVSVFKVHSSNKNIKFFRSGDKLLFHPATEKEGVCTGYVRTREEEYFTMYVNNISKCWKLGKYFRRGTLIKVFSELLARRVKDAAIHRVVLLKRRKDFLQQLNEINHFSWSYEEKKIQIAAEYDQKILEIQKRKRIALDSLMTRKNESATLRQGLVYKLDHIDKDLDFYRVEPFISQGDRWFDDHDLGLPVKNRPVPPIY